MLKYIFEVGLSSVVSLRPSSVMYTSLMYTSQLQQFDDDEDYASILEYSS